jgi:hypothetical protein
VTRLVELSPVGRLFTFGRGLKITEVAQMFEICTFSTAQVMYLFDKKWLGPDFWYFFTNSFCHPGTERIILSAFEAIHSKN